MDNQPVAVSFNLPVTSGGAAPVTTGCTPASGNTFPVGQTPVACNATDGRGIVAMCTFNVTVHPPPRMAATRYVAFGDSITWGVDSPPLRTAGPSFAYPEQLRQRLASRFREQLFIVDNEGQPGEYAQDASARLRSVLELRRPEVLLLMEGTNDLLQFDLGVERAITGLREMIGIARSMNVRVALATVAPQRVGGPRMRFAALLVPSFNDRVRALAVAENVPLIDVYAGMKDDVTLIGEDDLHPTIRGFDVMANIFYEGVRTHFEEKFTAAPAARR
jgi:lysophospholipase L1-like esterase